LPLLKFQPSYIGHFLISALQLVNSFSAKAEHIPLHQQQTAFRKSQGNFRYFVNELKLQLDRWFKVLCG